MMVVRGPNGQDPGRRSPRTTTLPLRSAHLALANYMKIAFVLDPLDTIKIYKDSSYAMMQEAASRGHTLAVLHQEDLVLHDGQAIAYVRDLELIHDEQHWYRVSERRAMTLDSFDVVMMRKDPPFDTEYVYST